MAEKTKAVAKVEEQGMSPLAAGLTGLASALLGLMTGWILYSMFGINHRMLLLPALDAERKRYLSLTEFFVNYYLDKSAAGRPLVLIHSINAGASACEMRPLFNHYRATRPVYALDLPGFGFSERSDREYSPHLYKETIADFLKTQIDEPADVVALSLSSEFAAMAVLEYPEVFHSLTLISPTGFTYRENQQADDSRSDRLYSLFAFPVWSQAFYDLLATRPSIHYFLQQSFEGEVDSGLEDYAYATTHQPGARYAPLYFVSGKLFSPDIFRDVYQRLILPVLVLYDRDNYTSFDLLPDLIRDRSNWRAERITPTRGLPHFEQLSKTVQALDSFWQIENS